MWLVADLVAEVVAARSLRIGRATDGGTAIQHGGRRCQECGSVSCIGVGHMVSRQ